MSVRFILAVVLLLVAAPLSGQDPAGSASVWGDIVDEWRTAIDDLPLGLDHQDVHGHRHHATTRPRASGLPPSLGGSNGGDPQTDELRIRITQGVLGELFPLSVSCGCLSGGRTVRAASDVG